MTVDKPGFDVPTRLIVTPKRGRDGLFIETDDVSPERETVETKNRMRFAEHFKFADPYTGNTRTNDENGDYNCGRCNQADGDTCLLVKVAKIDRGAGSCGHWENLCAGDTEMLLRELSPEAAAYGVARNGVGFGCARCPFASRAVAVDSRGRDLYCGKGDFRVFGNSCCALNGAPTIGSPTLMDLGPSDVHVSGSTPDYVPTRTPTDLANLQVKTMGDLDAAARKRIPSNKFADPAGRAYPVHTKSHADNAAARLEQQKSSMSPGKYARIKSRIKAAQKRFGEPAKTATAAPRTRGPMKGLRMITTHPDGTRIEVRHMNAADADGLCVLPALPLTLGDD